MYVRIYACKYTFVYIRIYVNTGVVYNNVPVFPINVHNYCVLCSCMYTYIHTYVRTYVGICMSKNFKLQYSGDSKTSYHICALFSRRYIGKPSAE